MLTRKNAILISAEPAHVTHKRCNANIGPCDKIRAKKHMPNSQVLTPELKPVFEQEEEELPTT